MLGCLPQTGTSSSITTISFRRRVELCMDERRFERSANFARLAADPEVLADALAGIPIEELRPYRAAAE